MSERKVIIITGASAGLGKDFSKSLAKEGMIVYAAARRIAKMDELKEMGVRTLAMDITKDADIKRVVDTVISEQGAIDCLINNAGYGLFGSVEDVAIEDARRQFEVNLFGLGRITQLCLPHMREKQSGRIINISSIGGKVHSPLGSWYHATKFALEGWSDCLRLEVSQFGIDVVIIEPGAIETEFGDVMIGPLMKRTGNGPYIKILNSFVGMFKEAYERGALSKPSVITNLVLKAVTAKKPKTRYAGGRFAHLGLITRRLVSDRMFDRMIHRMLK